jgi:hypothetical protein
MRKALPVAPVQWLDESRAYELSSRCLRQDNVLLFQYLIKEGKETSACREFTWDSTLGRVNFIK